VTIAAAVKSQTAERAPVQAPMRTQNIVSPTPCPQGAKAPDVPVLFVTNRDAEVPALVFGAPQVRSTVPSYITIGELPPPEGASAEVQ
jgi:hypothetical protein